MTTLATTINVLNEAARDAVGALSSDYGLDANDAEHRAILHAIEAQQDVIDYLCRVITSTTVSAVAVTP